MQNITAELFGDELKAELKNRGFRKNRLYWHKEEKDLTIIFFIQIHPFHLPPHYRGGHLLLMVKTACPNDNVHSKQLCAFYLLYTRNPDLSPLIFNFFEKVKKFVDHVHITFLYTVTVAQAFI